MLAIAQGQELTQKLYIVSASMLSEYQARKYGQINPVYHIVLWILPESTADFLYM